MTDSVYRLARGHALMLCGLSVVGAAVSVFVAFLLLSRDGWVAGIGVGSAVLAALLLLLAVRYGVRPPVVARLGGAGFVFARPRRVRGTWEVVDDVRLDGRTLELTGEGATARLDWDAVEPADRAVLARDVYDRLNTVNGYTRFS